MELANAVNACHRFAQQGFASTGGFWNGGEADDHRRLYVSYGKAWFPDRITQVRKNPRVLWWVMRDAIFNH